MQIDISDYKIIHSYKEFSSDYAWGISNLETSQN